jgi:uroporphyrinogen-III synthase
MVTGRYEWVGFTSVNAVRAIREKFDEFGLDARSFAGLRVAAVGGVTAQALRDWGITPDLVPTGEQSALGLLEVWPAFDPDLDPIARVFLPRADIATETLVAGLQDIGWEVDDVTAYRTVRAAPPPASVRDAIKNGSFDAVLFTSSSTVRNLVGIAGKPHPTTVIACIGPATAKTAEELGLRVDVLAPVANADALVDALADHGRSLALAAQEAGEVVLRPEPASSGFAPPRHVMGFPQSRPRRLRRTPAIRRLVAQTRLHPADLVLPVFVREGIEEPVPISAMPGVVQHTLDSLVEEARRCVQAGLGGIMVFGGPDHQGRARVRRGRPRRHPQRRSRPVGRGGR